MSEGVKKICILIDGISKSGGTDRVLSTVANILDSKGHEITVYSLTEGEPYYEINKTVTIRYATKKNRFAKLFQFSFFIKNNNFDSVIIISMGRLSAQIIPILKIVRVHSNIVCSDHVAIESFPKTIRLIKYFSYYLANYIVVLTKQDKIYLSSIFKNDKIAVIRNASPFEEKFRNNMEKEKIAIAVGRLTYQKNFFRLIDIWKKRENKSWKLYIIGEGEDRDKLQEYITEDDGVHLVGACKKIDEWYKRASLLLMTSRYEGLPMVLIEAKNFGLPVIAFDCKTGPSELIDNDGIVINYNDDENFIVNLNKTLDDNVLLNEMMENALINSAFYEKNAIYAQWLKVIDKSFSD
ncbi:TPA: glycosyltransferase family 4 protein [Raoultella ornithinolytica]|nr:glycosyltransferase family 4 protein [Raoultella ornithinolytica]HEQ3490342.1 glycosyltransferase family 4 protein [Raoultella ornithinolytica]